MALPQGEIPSLHLSLECGDNAAKPQTTKTETPDFTVKDCEERTQSQDFAPETLFLSKRNLKDVPESILTNSTLKNLYLEGNHISSFPRSFFTSLPNLVWLDLRHNRIASLPVEIGLHRSLRTLLLEGNPITELPAELGNVITLKALNLRNCPLIFPPKDIVHQGLQGILQYLRTVMAKRLVSMQNCYSDMPPVEKLQLSELLKSSVDLGEEVADENEDELVKFEELKNKIILMDRAETDNIVPILPLAQTPRTMEDNRNLKLYPLPAIRRKKSFSKANVVPELPPFDMQYCQKSEQRRLAVFREVKERQEILEQRRKDQEVLQEWRTQAKIIRERKILECKHERLERQRREEQSTPKTNLCTTNSNVTGLGNDEARAHITHSAPQRQRPFVSQMENQETRATRERELQQRIRSHVHMLQERRRKPRGSLHEVAVAAQQDMAETMKLQAEILERKRAWDNEYRFVAYTGETPPDT